MAKKVKLTKDGRNLEFSTPDVEFLKTQGWSETVKETPQEKPQSSNKGK